MDFYYEDILDALEEQNIALFLGPGILKNDDGEPLETELLKMLEVDNPDNPMIRAYYKNDGFYLFKAENQRKRVVRRIKSFFDGEFGKVDALLDKLVHLPFPVVISMIPDPLLVRAFERAGLPFHQDYYNMGHPFRPFIAPSSQKPLIYSLIGSMEEPESMVMTHKDLFKYMKSIFDGNSMSDDLRKLIQDTDAFVFLGLPFEKWYMQLLLRVLYHISARLESIEQYACTDAELISGELYKDEFKIQFVSDRSETFIEALHKQCEEKGILRSVSEEGVAVNYKEKLDRAQDLFSKNKIEKGVQQIIDVLNAHLPKAQDLLDETIKNQQSYSDLFKKEVIDMATDTDKANLNKTIFNFIKLIPTIQRELELR